MFNGNPVWSKGLTLNKRLNVDQKDQLDQSGSSTVSSQISTVWIPRDQLGWRKTAFYWNAHTTLRHVASVADPASRIRLFTSRIQGWQDPGSASKNLNIFNPKILILSSQNKIRDVHPRLRILQQIWIYSIPDPDQGSKKHRIPDPDPQLFIEQNVHLYGRQGTLQYVQDLLVEIKKQNKTSRGEVISPLITIYNPCNLIRYLILSATKIPRRFVITIQILRGIFSRDLYSFWGPA